MSKSTETGHLRNVTNFAKLINNVTAIGDSYQPPKESLKVENLQSIYDATVAVMDEAAKANTDCTLVVNMRQLAFKPLSRLITRINNNLKASDSPQLIDEAVRSLVRRLRGERASSIFTPEEVAALEAEGKSAKQASSSQMGYDTRLYNFEKLITILSSIPEYKPNEPELKIEALKALYAKINKLNMDVIVAQAELDKIRGRRQDLMYNNTNALVTKALDAKAYLRSISSGPYDNLIKATLRLKFRYLT